MVTSVIRKWYERLEFPPAFDRACEAALEQIPIDPGVSIETYDLQCPDGKRNLLSFLYMCEALEETYRELGIGQDILLDTLRDIVRWTENWSAVKGELCLFELEWLARIMRAKLFKVGRLQFYMAPPGWTFRPTVSKRGTRWSSCTFPVGGGWIRMRWMPHWSRIGHFWKPTSRTMPIRICSAIPGCWTIS